MAEPPVGPSSEASTPAPLTDTLRTSPRTPTNGQPIAEPRAPADSAESAGSGETTTTDASSVAAKATNSRLLRSSAVVSIGTLSSRVTGLLRTVVAAAVLGATTGLADAFNLANTLPNLLFDLLAGGVLAATVVPAFTEARARRDRAATEAIVSVLGVSLMALTGVAMVFAPLAVAFFDLDDRSRRLTLFLSLVFLPQIFFYGITTILSGLLNSFGRFAAAALAPVVTNIIAIATLVVFGLRATNPSDALIDTDVASVLLLSIGTTLSVAAMSFALLPAVRGLRLRLRWRFDLHHPAVRRVTRLSGWMFGYVAINQAALWLILRLAHDVGSGPLTYYLYAYQFFQLPYGVLAAAVMTAFLPELTALVQSGDRIAFGDRFLQGLRLTLVLILPATAAFLVLATPLVSVLLERGAFSAIDAATTGEVLSAFAIGLPGFCLYLLAMRGFYAHANTRVPFLINAGQTALQVGLCGLLVGPLGVRGLALGFALAYIVGAGFALFWLDRYAGGLPWGDSVRSIAAISAAAGAALMVMIPVDQWIGADHGWGALARVGVAGALGGFTFLGVARTLRIPELTHLETLLARR